jgi:hypothetical protein
VTHGHRTDLVKHMNATLDPDKLLKLRERKNITYQTLSTNTLEKGACFFPVSDGYAFQVYLVPLKTHTHTHTKSVKMQTISSFTIK